MYCTIQEIRILLVFVDKYLWINISVQTAECNFWACQMAHMDFYTIVELSTLSNCCVGYNCISIFNSHYALVSLLGTTMASTELLSGMEMHSEVTNETGY